MGTSAGLLLPGTAAGLVSESDPAMVVGVMGVIGLVVQNRNESEEHGEEYYEQVQELLIRALSRGLTASPR